MLAVSKASEVHSTCYNGKLRANIDGMHYEEHACMKLATGYIYFSLCEYNFKSSVVLLSVAPQCSIHVHLLNTLYNVHVYVQMYVYVQISEDEDPAGHVTEPISEDVDPAHHVPDSGPPPQITDQTSAVSHISLMSV